MTDDAQRMSPTKYERDLLKHVEQELAPFQGVIDPTTSRVVEKRRKEGSKNQTVQDDLQMFSKLVGRNPMLAEGTDGSALGASPTAGGVRADKKPAKVRDPKRTLKLGLMQNTNLTLGAYQHKRFNPKKYLDDDDPYRFIVRSNDEVLRDAENSASHRPYWDP